MESTAGGQAAHKADADCIPGRARAVAEVGAALAVNANGL